MRGLFAFIVSLFLLQSVAGAQVITKRMPAAETDPVYSASSWSTTTNNADDWDTAYGWGNHATQGYIKGVNWEDIGGIQSDINVSGFTNDAGYITSGGVPDTGWTKTGRCIAKINSRLVG